MRRRRPMKKDNKTWRLSQVDESDLSNPTQVTGSQTLTGEWKTNLTPEKLGVVAMDPDSLSISGLHDYSKYLQQSGQESNRYELSMWSKVFAPFSVAVMMLMALSFILAHCAACQWVSGWSPVFSSALFSTCWIKFLVDLAWFMASHQCWVRCCRVCYSS